jgi:THAP domain
MEENKCAIKTCGSMTNNLFCSPADKDMLKKWQEILGIEDEFFLICENHFSMKDIVIEKCLEHTTAIPCIDITEQQTTVDNDCCGICLEKLEDKCQLSKQESDDFKAITGYQVCFILNV